MVLILMGICAGFLGMLAHSSWISGPSHEGAVRHAEMLQSWLQRKTMEAFLANEEFRLVLPAGGRDDRIFLRWSLRNLVEEWRGEGYFFVVPGVPLSRFGLPLGTFTPAFTVYVSSEGSFGALPDATVTLSLYGKVTVRDLVP